MRARPLVVRRILNPDGGVVLAERLAVDRGIVDIRLLEVRPSEVRLRDERHAVRSGGRAAAHGDGQVPESAVGLEVPDMLDVVTGTAIGNFEVDLISRGHRFIDRYSTSGQVGNDRPRVISWLAGAAVRGDSGLDYRLGAVARRTLDTGPVTVTGS